MKNKTPIRFLAVLALGAMLLTGCARSTPETKPPRAPELGVIDMDKAIAAHPKHQEWQKLKQQAATIDQQMAAIAGQAAGWKMPALNLSGSAVDGLRASAEQEFNAKIAAKQQELEVRLAGKADKVRDELTAELREYAEQLEKEYQTPQFNLQMKLQVVRMNEKEAAETKEELDGLKAEQAEKIAARQQELAKGMEAALAPEKAAIEQELAAYAQQLQAEISSKMAAQTAGMAGSMAQQAALPDEIAGINSLKQQLGMKQQELNVVEEYIVNDIRDKTAKVASEKDLGAVLTGYRVNVNAVDITDAVIAAVKK